MRSILVAAASPTIRRIVELTFSDTDVRVEPASSGAQALSRLEALSPDLVLADVALAEPSAYELCRTIKAGSRPVPVLLLTGSFDPFDRERARECGADGHLVKPFESSALRERVLTLLGEKHTRKPVETAPVSAPPAAASQEAPPPAAWIDAVVEEVVRRLSDATVRQIAAEVVPRLAREMIRERIRELEAKDDD